MLIYLDDILYFITSCWLYPPLLQTQHRNHRLLSKHKEKYSFDVNEIWSHFLFHDFRIKIVCMLQVNCVEYQKSKWSDIADVQILQRLMEVLEEEGRKLFLSRI